MLKVFASNNFNILFEKLTEEYVKSTPSKVFSSFTLVTGTRFIADKLKRAIAQKQGICAGIEFQSQQVWQARTMGTARQSGVETLSMIWAIWLALSDKNFVAGYPRIRHFLEKSDSLAKFQLAKRITDTFSDYLRYRPEWMSAWLDGNDPVNQPDSDWQMDLWQRVNQLDKNIDKYLQKGVYEENLKNMPSPLHFFMPVNLSPAAIDALKTAANQYGKEITVYLFASIGSAGSSNTFIQKYGERTKEIINVFESGEQAVSVTFLENHNDRSTLLTEIQKALWSGSAENLPTTINSDDDSLRIVCTVSPTREIENAVDIIHHWVRNGIRAEDILVVAPDIQSLVPNIHSVVRALPIDKSISYRIMGEAAPEETIVSSAFLGLGKLLGGRCTIDDFEAWLELPAVSDAFGLNLNDLAILKDWLVSAGFMFGINERHLKYLGLNTDSAADATLARAIERLALGLVIDDNIELVGETLPVRKGKTFRFQTLEGRNNLFSSLLRIYDLLENLFNKIPQEEASPKDWNQFSHQLLEALFSKGNYQNDAIAIQALLVKVLMSFSALEKQPLLPFEVYWKALEFILRESSQGTMSNDGRVTFANMGTMRGLPYKVTIALGLDGDSNFPGEQTFHEFHLMGKTVSRIGDPDRQADSHTIFIDLLSSTDTAFILSFAGDRKKDRLSPSVVVEDLSSFANSNTGTSPAQWLQSLEACIGRASTSEENFLEDKNNKRYWITSNSTALAALKKHIEEPRSEPLLIDGGINLETEGVLTFKELMAFYKDPEIWAERKLGLKVVEEDIGESPDFLGDQSFLGQYNFFNQIFARLQSGWSKEDIARWIAASPVNGAKAIRLANHQTDLDLIAKGYELYHYIRKSHYEIPEETPSFMKPIKRSHFREFRVDSSDLYRLKNEDRFELFMICRSDSAIYRQRLLQCALAYTGCRTRLVVLCPRKVKAYHADTASELTSGIPMEDWKVVQYFLPDFPESVIKELIACYERALVDVTAMAGEDKSYLTGNSLPDRLWRGRDWDAALKDRKAWKAHIDSLMKAIDQGKVTSKVKTKRAKAK